MSLNVRLRKTYRSGVRIEGDLSIPVDPGNVFVLFGPSGCGKTTWLRCIAGLERPEQGVINWNGECWLDSSRAIDCPPQKRKIGFVFQENALFPHMTVADNIAYGIRETNAAERKRSVDEFVSRLQLNGLEHRYPKEISVGQAQRVALARTLATRPRLLLLDEPFAALDTPLRHELRRELRTILFELGIPTILVTHDRQEALSLGKSGALLYGGRVVERGLLDDWMLAPQTRESARCIGFENIIACTRAASPSTLSAAGADGTSQTDSATDPQTAPFVSVEALQSRRPFVVHGKWRSGVLSSNNAGERNRDRGSFYACFSADSVQLDFLSSIDASLTESKHVGANHWVGTIQSVVREGAMVRIEIDAGVDIIALIPCSEWEKRFPTPPVTVKLTVARESVQVVGSLEES